MHRRSDHLVLLNLRLAREVANAREMEAFQTMSAFFVHDLKNAASSLNLMLQNLPVHFDDPAFRADALRGIGNTARRIDEMIARLSAFRQQPALRANAHGPQRSDRGSAGQDRGAGRRGITDGRAAAAADQRRSRTDSERRDQSRVERAGRRRSAEARFACAPRSARDASCSRSPTMEVA